MLLYFTLLFALHQLLILRHKKYFTLKYLTLLYSPNGQHNDSDSDSETFNFSYVKAKLFLIKVPEGIRIVSSNPYSYS